MLIAIGYIVVGFVLLLWAADRFVLGSAAIARNLGIPALLVGLTIVALGTSAPEIFVAIMAAIKGEPALGIGNAIGSNVANVGLVIGITALIRPIAVHSKLLKREYPVLFLIMVVVTLMLINGYLGRLEGAILLASLGVLLVWLVWTGRNPLPEEPMATEFQEEIPSTMSNSRALAWLALGLILLPISAEILVQGAVSMAKLLGISDLVIGLTVVAIGTSLPEAAASIIGVLRNEPDIAIGNVLGSNMFNLLGVMAFPGLIAPSKVDHIVLYRDIPVMFAFTIALYLMSYSGKKRGRINRLEGGVLFLGYAGYLVLLYFTD